jgi:hypothetical protein
MKSLIAALAGAICTIAFGQDVTFYTDTGSNFCDTGFTMPATSNVPGTYAETIACPYIYTPVTGEQPGVSQLMVSSANYAQGRYLIRHYVSHIVTAPQLFTVTPVYVLLTNFDALGNQTYAVSGSAYNAGSPVQYDANFNLLDQNGVVVVSCAQSYNTNPDGTATYNYQGCMTGYIGNYVDANHQAQEPQFSSPVAAIDTGGLSVVFTCASMNNSLPLAYKDRVVDVCTLGTQQADGSVTAGALLPPSEYWIVLPLDTSCSIIGTALCGPGAGNSGGAPIYSRSAFGAAPPPPATCGTPTTPPCDD